MPDLIGQSIGRYHILEKLGEGGMAIVYKAYDTRLERNVAVKVIRVDEFPRAALERILKRFDREAKALGRLNHPNIVSVIDYGEYNGEPYLVMVYQPGGTLKKMMGKPLPWADAVRLLLPLARALDYAHKEGVIHRDVKPSNILITRSGEPMLTDFGIAKLLEVDESHTLTGTGVGIGTPEYMAPEQGMGKTIDGRADMYSLGIVFYELVTGKKPFMADTPMAVVFKHMTDPLPRPKQFVGDLPDAVEKVIIKALAKKTEDRYLDMGVFADALETLGTLHQRSTKSGAVRIDPDATIDVVNITKKPSTFRYWPAWLAMLGLVILVLFLSNKFASGKNAPQLNPTVAIPATVTLVTSTATLTLSPPPPSSTPQPSLTPKESFTPTMTALPTQTTDTNSMVDTTPTSQLLGKLIITNNSKLKRSMNITLDGTLIGTLKPGQSVTAKVSFGFHRIVADGSYMRQIFIDINVTSDPFTYTIE